ncbi:MAG: hypothetical protein IPP42_11775 [Saprospiraceae bacterium]|nr:hypothetical protein [Saprospiraceae bacterium]
MQDNEADAINIVRLADQVTQEISFNYEQLAEISPLYGAGHKGGQYIFLKRERKTWCTNQMKVTKNPCQHQRMHPKMPMSKNKEMGKTQKYPMMVILWSI